MKYLGGGEGGRLVTVKNLLECTRGAGMREARAADFVRHQYSSNHHIFEEGIWTKMNKLSSNILSSSNLQNPHFLIPYFTDPAAI